jgi:hypothetical protein
MCCTWSWYGETSDMPVRRPALLAAAALVLVLVPACGESSSATTGGGQPQRPAHPHGVACWSALVTVAGEDGVRYTVRCNGPKNGGLVHFSVSRSGFSWVGRYPMVSGRGALARHALCRRQRKQVIDCQARAKGAVTVKGLAKVVADSLCTEPVSVTTVAASKCRGQACPNQVSTVELWSDIPRGC